MASSKREQCNVPGCEAPQFKGGVCKKHSQENYVVQCNARDCDREAYAKGFCRGHYMKRYRNKKKGAKATREAIEAPLRKYGCRRVSVFARIPEEDAELLKKASGRKDGLYEKASRVLEDYAAKLRRDAARV